MPDSELLNETERKEKIRKLIVDLSARFNELIWNDSSKVVRLNQYKPSAMSAFWQRWDELDNRCKEYLEGKIDWDGQFIDMEFTSVGKFPFPVLKEDRDVVSFARDLYSWLVFQVQTLP